tara:strand:- start:67 stop:1422 length:1356 start_codon:yes stop_codon:yes gene_type:complete
MDLTQGNIKKQLISMAIPAGTGLFFYTLYNIVDTFYAGLISTEAVAGLAISFPLYFILLAFAVGFGQGTTALVSIYIGKKREDEAIKIHTQALIITMFVSLLVGFFTFIIAKSVFIFFGADGIFLENGLKYFQILSIGAPIFIVSFVINSLLYAQGDTRKNRNALIISFFINLIFSPFLSLGLGPLPALGTLGIGLATVISQLFHFFYLGYFAYRSPLFKSFKLSYLNLEIEIILKILKQSLPSCVNMLLIAIGYFITQKFVTSYGASASAAYGIALRIEQIILLPAIGFSSALLSMVGQNYGAKNFDRIYKAFIISLQISIYMMIFGAFILFFAGETIALLFSRDKDVIKIAGTYLFMAAFLCFVYQIIDRSDSVLSGMRKPIVNVFYTFIRLVMLPPFVIYFFSENLKYGLNGIWWAIFATNAFGSVFIYINMRYLYKKEYNKNLIKIT